MDINVKGVNVVDIAQGETTRPVVTEQQKLAMIEAKKRVQNILNCLETMAIKHGKNKQVKQAIKVMQEFLKCNVTNPAIFRKYNTVVTFIEMNAQLGVLENDSQA